MNTIGQQKEKSSFHTLMPDTVINLVEDMLGVHCTNLFRPLNSYINRVFELEKDDGEGVVVKFYRPGRWSKKGLQDEHDFLFDLAKLEIPVISPLMQVNGETIGKYEEIFFAIFPKCGGRSFDEFTDDQWLEIGRLLGRFHNVGEKKTLTDRPVMTPGQSTRQQFDFILANNLVPPDILGQFQELTDVIIETITPMFDGCEMIRIHGDCHFSNIIYRPNESFFLIDLDDMAMGPPVQDFWMLLPDYMKHSLIEIDLFLEGYETFRSFDKRSLSLIEPLRAMRYIHYMAWCAYQVVHDGWTPVNPNFGTQHYWQVEMKDLYDQLERIKDMEDHFGNYY